MSMPLSRWSAQAFRRAFQKTLTNVFRPRGVSTPRRRSRRPGQQISLESLELRQMLSAVPFSPAFPHALSITTGSGVVADSASFTVTFNQPVIGVDAADFNVVATGTVANGIISSVTGKDDTYTVNVTGITGSGTLGLNLVSLPTITALPSFAAQSAFATGNTPFSVTLGDVNGDGRLDMITANKADDNVSVLLGNGNGTFAAQTTFATGGLPYSVTLGDVNGDGKLDIITANQLSNNASVLLGNGNGTFGANTDFATGDAPQSVTLGDVNRDGKLDIITANSGSVASPGTTTSVLLGNGNGTFLPKTDFATGTKPISVTLGDLNRDGILDIITANEGSDNVSVLRGNGNGTFGTAVNHSTGDAPSSVTLGDVNGDGVLDIITANRSGNVSVLLGNGIAPGDFGPATDFAAGASPISVTLGDVNGDGRLDIITANYGGNSTSVLLGNGDGTFAATTTFSTGMATSPRSVALGDVNGDGRLDIITANRNTSTTSVLLGTGGSAITATFTTQPSLATGNAPRSVTKGDVNGDGFLDIITANEDDDNVSVLLGNGNGTFKTQATFATGTAPLSVALGDVNGDGKLDIITANLNNNVSILLGNGNGTFGLNTDFATGATPISVTLGDVNGDGILDIITANFYSDNVSVLLGDGDGTFQAQLPFGTGLNSYPASVTLGDVNGDGKLDIITANYDSDNVSVLLNTTVSGSTTPTFAAQASPTTGSGSEPYSVTLGDVNGDGKLDIITANKDDDTASVLLGNGNGTFIASLPAPSTGDSPRSVTLGDVNGDGKLDIITANGTSNNASVLLGNGDGTFATAVNYTTGDRPKSVTLGDVNGDGILDIITANERDDNVSVLLGNGDGTFQIPPLATGTEPYSVTLGDVNGDGILDIITANYDSDNISVLLGNGNGTFQGQLTFGTGNAPSSVTLGDVNRDGKLDVITANERSNNASVLLGNGNGTFGVNTDFATGSRPFSVPLGDVNGDGILDIITANRDSNSASVLLGNGDGTFQTQATFATGDVPRSVTLGDVNGDGILDIITANRDSDNASVLLGNGNGTFGIKTDFTTGDRPLFVTLGDVNGDGHLDIITANSNSDDASVLLGNGNGTFSAKTDFGTGTNPYSLTLGDVNGDGILDIITANYGSDDASVLLGNGNGTFQGQQTFGTGAGTSPASVVLGDVNGDGRLDIITANYGSNNASVLLNILAFTGQTATVAPSVTVNTVNVSVTAATLTIAGTGFDTTVANNIVTFSSGTGIVTSATATQLTVSFITAPSLGSLTAVVTTNAISSGSAVQVANIVANTTTALTSSVNPSVFGQSVTFTATVAPVSPGAGTATGSVEFFNGGTSLGIVTLSSGSATSAAITNFGVGTHSITAVYSGDSSFATSTSSVVSQVVDLGMANTPTFGPPTATAGGFTVQISNYNGAFTYGGTATAGGTVAISNTGLVTVSGVAANTSSTATITTTQAGYANGSAQVTATSLSRPTINWLATLWRGRTGTPFVMTYATLQSALKVANGVSIVIQSVQSGVVQKWSGTAWVTVSTAPNASLTQRTVSAGDKIRWVPPAGVSGDRLAFKAKAWDGSLYSLATARVTINLTSVSTVC